MDMLEEHLDMGPGGGDCGPFGKDFPVAKCVPLVWNLVAYEYDPLIQDALQLAFRMLNHRKEVCNLLVEQQILFDQASEDIWNRVCLCSPPRAVVEGCGGVWRGVEGCGGVWRGVEGCGGLWEGCGGVWRGVEGCGGVWRGVEGCGGVWRGVEG